MPTLETLDLRTRHRYLRKGAITQKEVDQYLAELPDVASNAEWIDYEKVFEQEVVEERAAPPKPAAPPPRPPMSTAPAAPLATAGAVADEDDEDEEDEEEDDADAGAAEGDDSAG